MIRHVVLDSTPLGLLTHRRGVRSADEAQDWLARHIQAGVRFVVPEIVDYELRRELLRLGKRNAIARLNAFNQARPDRLLPLTSAALRLAAELWARARQQAPTADPQALDVDVILSAQALTVGFAPREFVVATGNLGHLSLFVPAAICNAI